MKRSPLRRSPSRARRKPAEVIQADIWRDGLGQCVLRFTGRCDGRTDAHHIVSVAKLRRAGLDDLVLDKANRLALCRYHHTNHHMRSAPVPRELLPDTALLFAAEHGVYGYIERMYPMDERPES